MHHKTAPSGAGEPAPETRGRVIRWARFYDLVAMLMSLGRAPAIRRMTVKMAKVVPGEVVLDVGCGTGTLTIAAKDRAGPTGQVHGIDASPEMIDVAREKAGKKGADVDFRVGLIEDIPFPDGQFDVVLSSLMLHHLPDDVKRQGFQEIRRVLKPDGRFLAIDLSPSGGVLGHLVQILGLHRGEGTLEEVSGMLTAAGFTAVQSGRTRYKVLWFVRAARGA